MAYQNSPPPKIYPSFGEAYNTNMRTRDVTTKHAYDQGYDPHPDGAHTGRMVFVAYDNPANKVTPGAYGSYDPYRPSTGGYKKNYTNKYKKGRNTKTRRSKKNRK